MMHLVTAYSIAHKSPDHIYPTGTMRDNSGNAQFVIRLPLYIGKSPISVLDLGCSGGGMVADFIAAGHVAVGVEGSNYSYLNKRAEWPKIPRSLFTADAARKFYLRR